MSGRAAPPKPWERAGRAQGAGSGPADALPKPWERPPGAPTQTVTPAAATTSALAAVTGGGGVGQAPPRPWERGPASTGPSTSYGTGYGNGYGAYGRPSYGGHGGAYGGGYGGYGSGTYGGYGGGMYGGAYGSGMYGRPGMYGGLAYGGGGMYGGGMYPYGGGPMGPYDPNDPQGPPQPPSAWQAMLHAISGVVHFFGRLSFLVDENAHAVHFFISALLQLLDRFGSLYGELARFVLRLLGFKARDKSAAAPKTGSDTAQPLPPPQYPARQSAVKPHGLPGIPTAAAPTSSATTAALGSASRGSAWESLWK